jgi:hypothetical protein
LAKNKVPNVTSICENVPMTTTVAVETSPSVYVAPKYRQLLTPVKRKSKDVCK